MKQRVGRPLKYAHLLIALEDNVVYSPALVARYGEIKGILRTDLSPKQLQKQRVRIRHTLARYRINHEFPKDGDGHVRLPGQSISVGWYGRRWKASALEELGLV